MHRTQFSRACHSHKDARNWRLLCDARTSGISLGSGTKGMVWTATEWLGETGVSKSNVLDQKTARG